jgi:HEAT repeat protein
LLGEYLKSDDRYLKLDVIRALGHTHSAKAVDLLLPYVSSDDWHFRTYSRSSLVEIGRPDLVPKDSK